MDIPHVLGISELIFIIHQLHSSLGVDDLGDVLPFIRNIYLGPMGEIACPLPVMTGHPRTFMNMTGEATFHHSKLV